MLRMFHDGVYMMFGFADLDHIGFGFVLRACPPLVRMWGLWRVLYSRSDLQARSQALLGALPLLV